MNYALVRSERWQLLDLETFARGARIHPELARRLVVLGLLQAERDPAGVLWFHPGELATAARIQRLRAGFSLNYAAVGLVMDLLDRIDELQVALLRSAPPGTGTASTTVMDGKTGP